MILALILTANNLNLTTFIWYKYVIISNFEKFNLFVLKFINIIHEIYKTVLKIS